MAGLSGLGWWSSRVENQCLEIVHLDKPAIGLSQVIEHAVFLRSRERPVSWLSVDKWEGTLTQRYKLRVGGDTRQT